MAASELYRLVLAAKGHTRQRGRTASSQSSRAMSSQSSRAVSVFSQYPYSILNTMRSKLQRYPSTKFFWFYGACARSRYQALSFFREGLGTRLCGRLSWLGSHGKEIILFSGMLVLTLRIVRNHGELFRSNTNATHSQCQQFLLSVRER